MWQSKEGEIRRKELLDAALELFYEQGYDATSINDIIKKVGVTKGSFYYHFKSKEEVLDAIALRHAEQMVEIIKEVTLDEGKSAVCMINALILRIQEYRAETKSDRLKTHNILNKTENLKLKKKIHENYISLSKPIIHSIIEKGIEEGVFNTTYPNELTELFINLSISFNGSLNSLMSEIQGKPENIKKIETKVLFYEEVIEKIFDIPKGTIKIKEPFIKNLLKNNK